MADEHILQAITTLSGQLSGRLDQIGERLSALEQRFANFEISFDAMNTRLQNFELRFDAMDQRLLHDFQAINNGFRRLSSTGEALAAIDGELQARRDGDLLTREELLDLKRRIARLEKRLEGG
jgi:chromosome segregation ATPase